MTPASCKAQRTTWSEWPHCSRNGRKHCVGWPAVPSSPARAGLSLAISSAMRCIHECREVSGSGRVSRVMQLAVRPLQPVRSGWSGSHCKLPEETPRRRQLARAREAPVDDRGSPRHPHPQGAHLHVPPPGCVPLVQGLPSGVSALATTASQPRPSIVASDCRLDS